MLLEPASRRRAERVPTFDRPDDRPAEDLRVGGLGDHTVDPVHDEVRRGVLRPTDDHAGRPTRCCLDDDEAVALALRGGRHARRSREGVVDLLARPNAALINGVLQVELAYRPTDLLDLGPAPKSSSRRSGRCARAAREGAHEGAHRVSPSRAGRRRRRAARRARWVRGSVGTAYSPGTTTISIFPPSARRRAAVCSEMQSAVCGNATQARCTVHPTVPPMAPAYLRQ